MKRSLIALAVALACGTASADFILPGPGNEPPPPNEPPGTGECERGLYGISDVIDLDLGDGPNPGTCKPHVRYVLKSIDDQGFRTWDIYVGNQVGVFMTVNQRDYQTQAEVKALLPRLGFHSPGFVPDGTYTYHLGLTLPGDGTACWRVIGNVCAYDVAWGVSYQTPWYIPHGAEPLIRVKRGAPINEGAVTSYSCAVNRDGSRTCPDVGEWAWEVKDDKATEFAMTESDLERQETKGEEIVQRIVERRTRAVVTTILNTLL